MADDFADLDHAELQLNLRAEEAAAEYAREFIADLLETAGHTLRLNHGDIEGVVRECATTLYDAGFDPHPDQLDADPIVWAFAGTVVYHDLETELAGWFRVAEIPPVTVAGHYPVWHDPMLDKRTVVMIHRDAIVPTPPGIVERPWLVEYPGGVVVAEVDHD